MYTHIYIYLPIDVFGDRDKLFVFTYENIKFKIHFKLIND